MKKYLFNFAQEGASLILVTMLLSVASLILYNQFQYDVFLTSFYLQFFYFLVCCFFFRDPIREIKTPIQDKFLSPDIGPSKKISNFLSFFNVHTQWVPLN